MRSTKRLLSLLSVAALLSTMLLSTVGAGVALAGIFSSPAHIPSTGDHTLLWTGQGTTNGEVSSAQCSGDTPNPGDLLWIFTTDGYTLGSPDPVLTVNGTDYSGTNFGGSWHFVTSGESPDPAVTDASVEFNVTSLGGGSLVLTISHGCPLEEAAIADIVTEVHDALHNDITGAAIDLGSTVHDSATLTWDPPTDEVPAGSTVTFYFFAGTPDTLEPPCTADPDDALYSKEFVLDGSETTPYNIDDALEQGPLGAGDYFYFAQFVSADTDVMTHAISPCEPFTVNKGETETVTTVVREDTGADVAIGGSVPLGTSVHDTAIVGEKVADISLEGELTYYFYENGDCDSPEAWSKTVAVDADGVAADSSSTGPLEAGDYSFNAEYLGNDDYEASGLSACEPFTVEKADTETVTTVIREDTGAVVPLGGSVPVGTSVHDTATVGPQVGTFVITGTVTYHFFGNGTCDATGEITSLNGMTWPDTVTMSGGLVPDSQSTDPLAGGAYSFNAHYSGDDNYNASTSACEPFAVRTPGKTMGFWGNKNGVARIIANGGYAANAVDIGRGALIDTQAESLKVLPKTLNACGKGLPIIFTGQTVSTSCSLASGINVNSLNTLAAQTLALGYNIELVAGYDGQTIGGLGCTPVGSLTTSSTVGDAFAAAVALIDGSASGGTTTQAQIGAMNTLLGCLNAET